MPECLCASQCRSVDPQQLHSNSSAYASRWGMGCILRLLHPAPHPVAPGPWTMNPPPHLISHSTNAPQTACGLRNGFQYTVQLQMEGACMRLMLNEADQMLVTRRAGGFPPLQQAHFDWVTEAGMKEQRIVVRDIGLFCVASLGLLRALRQTQVSGLNEKGFTPTPHGSLNSEVGGGLSAAGPLGD